MQKRRFFNVLINSRPIFLYSNGITDMWKSGESSISRRKQKEKSQCQRLPNRESPESLAGKRSFQKLKMKAGWEHWDRKDESDSQHRKYSHKLVCAHMYIQKERNRWICMENWWQTVWKKPGKSKITFRRRLHSHEN